MSPDEYINRAAEGFKRLDSSVTIDSLWVSRDASIIKQYAKEMESGDKFPTLMLDYTRGFGQEGLHRAMAAKLLGLKEIPVMIVSHTRRRTRNNTKPAY